MTFITILRGINVSGKNIIRMNALQKMFENLGFQNVATYVQSGNVIFTYPVIDTDHLEKKISNQIEKEFGLDVPVIVLTIEELQHIVDNNPFSKDPGRDQKFLHVTFLSATPDSSDIKTIEDKRQSGEDISFAGKAVYLYCPNGYGKTKLTNNLLERKLKVVATTRNWNTTTELLKMAGK